MSVHKKLMQARIQLQNTKLKKSGLNKFAGYDYFELGDFLPSVQTIFDSLGLCGVVSYAPDVATLTITDVDGGGSITLTSPMAEANLKGCHPIQNLGAVETYTRRYLWVTAMEIVEHDALDATAGKESATKAVGANFKEHAEKKGTITPSTGVWEKLDGEEQKYLREIAAHVTDLLNNDDAKGAVRHIQELKLDADERVALNTLFDSKQRSAMKAANEQLKEAA